ncbi:Membrane-bound lysozyme-inhibitor of c-type lysozyme [Labrenzia sp. THAF191b]|uniref:MliC family protein n=1 Tax=unclassified Labrenzia TaxID=2648686 RepID=UPI001267DA42|nr:MULTISPECIES: MliC family protein [unclassified Labrenzia]QFS98000.1 Membrane-bound lysozyme-inhibitor of c-type lysozyme [Labrenzia sp. THAF191b]QFT04314.1 Membrane-bound lysozyme-inhibitor of c-type lysozyme [Labrenzia sp. THAF191a]QFT15858.1 Membrane-bound lysozyme-inhibitor of c-type lysozyme [Labrenzia sp. THAF187b]
MNRFSLFVVLAALVLPASIAFASPDVDFPQNGASYGGKVRSGPGMQYGQSGSLRQGDAILILSGTGVMMNGYEWFQVRYRNGQTGFHWGGLFCSERPYPGIYEVCGGRPQVQNPVPQQPGGQLSAAPGVNGQNVGVVRHSGGSFTNIGNGQWQEADVYGTVNFHFQEFGRDDWSVYLHDASRNVTLQLDLHRRMILYEQGNGPRSDLYQITDAFPARNYQPAAAGNVAQPAAGDSITVHYTCTEGLPLTATYVQSGNGHLIYTIDGHTPRRLEQVVSGSGARYTDGQYTAHSKGRQLLRQSPSGIDDCYENQ